MKDLQPTPKESQVVRFTFNTTLITTLAICFTLCFGFFKMEKTTEDTKAIAELEVRKKEAEAKIALSKSPEYRPIVVSYRTVVLSTAYLPSLSRYTNVSVSAKITCTASLAGGQDGSISLQVSPDNITYTTVSVLQNNNSVALAIALTAVNGNTATLCATVPAGYYYRLISTSTTGTPTFSITTQAQETAL